MKGVMLCHFAGWYVAVASASWFVYNYVSQILNSTDRPGVCPRGTILITFLDIHLIFFLFCLIVSTIHVHRSISYIFYLEASQIDRDENHRHVIFEI